MTARLAEEWLVPIVESGATLRTHRGRSVVGGALGREIVFKAAALRAAGLEPGCVLGWPGELTIDHVVLDLACQWSGIVSCPLPNDIGDEPPCQVDVRLSALGDLRAGQRATEIEAHHHAREDVVTVKFTSGTTRQRRAVGATAGHCVHTARGISELFSIGPDDTMLALLPGSVWLQRIVMQIALASGATVVLAARPNQLIRALGDVRPTIVVAVPRVLDAALEAAHASARPLGELWGGRLRSLWSGSAPLGPATLDAYLEAGVPVHEGYGSTETGMIAKNAPGRCRPGSVGRIFPGVGVEIRDGQLLVVSEDLANDRYMDGTHGNWIDEHTFATGDRAHFDPAGYLHLEGRLDDVIVLSTGQKIHPASIERSISSGGVVDRCVVVGNGRPWIGALVVAGDDVPEEQLLELVRRVTAALPEPERVRAVARIAPLDRIPGVVTPAGKLDRQVLLARCAEEIESMYVR